MNPVKNENKKKIEKGQRRRKLEKMANATYNMSLTYVSIFPVNENNIKFPIKQ